MSSDETRQVGSPDVEQQVGRSIASTIAIYSLASTVAALLLASILMYVTLQRGLERRSEQVIHSKLDTIVALLGDAEPNAAWIKHELDEGAEWPLQLFIRIVTPPGNPLAASTMPEELDAAQFPYPVNAAQAASHSNLLRLPSRRIFRIAAAKVTRSKRESAKSEVVQIAMDLGLRRSIAEL